MSWTPPACLTGNDVNTNPRAVVHWLRCPIVVTSGGRAASAVLGVLAVALIGCASSGGRSGGASPDASGGLASQVLARGSDLASALDAIPDVPDAYVMFTDWSMLGHQDPKDPDTAQFASELIPADDAMQRDLGIRSVSADWEIDTWRPGYPQTIVLHFNGHIDLAGLAGKLIRLGYHANGSIFTHPLDPRRPWTLPLRNIGIAADRQLLIGSPDATAVRSVLASSASPLGHADSVAPLLALAAARLGRVATASIAVGKPACVTLASMLGINATREQLATLRKRFTRAFTPPQAEITALDNSAAETALDVLTFPDAATAQVNKAARSGVAKLMNTGNPFGIRVSGPALTGRVVSFTLTAPPQTLVQAVLHSDLGVDICT